MKDLSWSDITLEQYMFIQEIKKQDSLDIMCEIIKIIFNIEKPEELPYTEFLKYSDKLKFLGKEITRVPLKDSYTINGTIYILNNNVMLLTTSQVIDYRNYSKEENNIHKLLSVFLIPKDHKYNENYDIEKVQNDILDLDMATVISLMDFFQKCWRQFIEDSVTYLTRQLDLKTIPEEKKKEIKEKLEVLQDLTYSL